MQAERLEVIIIAGVEGGGVTLRGERRPNGWRFRRSYADQTVLMLNEAGPENVKDRESPWIDSWEEALCDLDGQGWIGLPAVHIHREFRGQVWLAVRERFGNGELSSASQKLLQRWQDRCRPESLA